MEVLLHHLRVTESTPRKLQRWQIYAEYQCFVYGALLKICTSWKSLRIQSQLIIHNCPSALFYKSECREYKGVSQD